MQVKTHLMQEEPGLMPVEIRFGRTERRHLGIRAGPFGSYASGRGGCPTLSPRVFDICRSWHAKWEAPSAQAYLRQT